MEPTYHLQSVVHDKDDLEDFEGPLYLILQLLSKNKIEIRDIRISEILDQYVAWLEDMKALDLEVASEFVQMASHLLYIKTKMLLSTDKEDISELEVLIESLEKLKAKDALERIKVLIPELREFEAGGILYLSKQPEPMKGAEEYRYSHDTWELLAALRDAALRSKTPKGDEQDITAVKRRIVPKRIVYNVHDKSIEIMDRLRLCRTLKLNELYMAAGSRSEVIAVFISVLELCSFGNISIKNDGGGIVLDYIKDEENTIGSAVAE